MPRLQIELADPMVPMDRPADSQTGAKVLKRQRKR
jgi:hypothetical protein